MWGGGWLSHLGANLGLGHGFVDFGGASLVFLAGSTVAMVALMLFKPSKNDPMPEPIGVVVNIAPENSLTVYHNENDDETSQVTPDVEDVLPPTQMPSAYLPILSLLGAGLILGGWLGVSAGLHMPTATHISPAQAAVNGLLAAFSAAAAAAGYSWFTTREFNPLMLSRSLVAGLIVAWAGAPFIPAWIMVGAGLTIGLLLAPLIYLFSHKLPLLDELGTMATYGVSALLALVLVALFADGRTGQGWNGIGLTDYFGVADQGVSGLIVSAEFVSDWPGQLQAQLLGSLAIFLLALAGGLLLLQTAKVIAKSWASTGLELADPTLAPAARLSQADRDVGEKSDTESALAQPGESLKR